MNPTLAVAEAESPRRLRAAARSATDEAASTPAASDATSANSFETLTSGGVAWEIVPAWRDLLAGDEGLPIERWLRERNAFVFKHGAGRTVYRVDLAERSFFIKHHRTRGLFKTIKDFFREGACRREYRRARELAAARREMQALLARALGGERNYEAGCSLVRKLRFLDRLLYNPS